MKGTRLVSFILARLHSSDTSDRLHMDHPSTCLRLTGGDSPSSPGLLPWPGGMDGPMALLADDGDGLLLSSL